MPPKLTSEERLVLIKRVLDGHEKIARVCREAGISRVLFYRWLKRYQQTSSSALSLTPKTGGFSAAKPSPRSLSAQDRLKMIERVASGEPVTAVCQAYGVSRVIFYRWKRRYDEALAGQKLEALWDKKPAPGRFYHQATQEVEKAVLAVVIKYPELSTHKIVEFLPQIGGKPILANHGVQNVLRRYDLTTYEKRLAYSSARLHVPGIYGRFLYPFEAVLGFLLSLPTQHRLLAIRLLAGFLLGFFSWIVIVGFQGYVSMMAEAPLENKIGLAFASIALAAGSFFFLYSLKYYLTLALVLGFSRHVGEGNGAGGDYRGGLQPNLEHITLERTPFVSIHLPMYNEKKVVNRLLTACTSMDYENYEVIVIDDSTDETTEILKDWQNHPRVKVIHRDSREGFKGGALKVALEKTDPRTEFVLIFDADFVPYPDTISQFLKYFQSVMGSLTPGESKVAAIQGYQWHVLNKSENWITRGVRSEYAGSYLVERSGAEVLGALKQIAGSVYMVRKDVLDKFGWQTSITEDFQLTLRLYEQGYKVVYTPYIQAPSECVSTIKRLVRQRMRWAEGHSYNVRKNFIQILFSPKTTLMEKLEFLYLSPYYLQAAFFLLGTLAWFVSETIFPARLPFWTALWGWSLVLTNMFALPLVNTVGLFLEESEERDYLGTLSFVVLSYLLVPFQAYASLKGFLEKEEGPWFRTPKTGKITDIFTRGKFYRWLSGIIPGVKPAPALSVINPYLSLITANNRFGDFQIHPKRLRWVSKVVLAILLCFTVSLYGLANNVSLAMASVAGTMYVRNEVSTLTGSWVLGDTVDTDSVTTTKVSIAKTVASGNFNYQPGVTNSTSGTPGTPTGKGWLSDDANGVAINTGTWGFTICETDNGSAVTGYLRVLAWKVQEDGSSITASSPIYDSSTAFNATDIWNNAANNNTFTSSSITGFTFDTTYPKLYIEYWTIITGNTSTSTKTSTQVVGTKGTTCATSDPQIVFNGGVVVPENLFLLIVAAPFIPMIVLWRRQRGGFAVVNQTRTKENL